MHGDDGDDKGWEMLNFGLNFWVFVYVYCFFDELVFMCWIAQVLSEKNENWK